MTLNITVNIIAQILGFGGVYMLLKNFNWGKK